MQNDELRRLEEKAELRRREDNLRYLGHQLWRLEMARHALLYEKYRPMVRKGDLAAIDMCIRIVRSECRLLGVKFKGHKRFDVVEVLNELGMYQLSSQPVML